MAVFGAVRVGEVVSPTTYDDELDTALCLVGMDPSPAQLGYENLDGTAHMPATRECVLRYRKRCALRCIRALLHRDAMGSKWWWLFWGIGCI